MTESPMAGRDLQAYARIAGAGYLVIFVLAIAANFGVLEALSVPGDAELTLANIQAQEGALRWAIGAFFVVLAADLIVGWALYRIFAPARPGLALLMLMFRLVYTVSHIGVVLLLVGALRVATAELAFPEEGMQAILASELLRGHGAGFTLTLTFFGIHLILLACLIWATGMLPRWLGVLVALAGAGYVLDASGWLLFPELRAAHLDIMLFIVIVPALVGEGLLMAWLLVRGARPARAGR